MGPRADPLIARLQRAYLNEVTAACAYDGHRRAVRDPRDRDRIRRIELDEWHHRRLVGAMLRELGARPSPAGEFVAFFVGRGLGLLCGVSGTFLPMYAAGWLECKNAAEYECTAHVARALGHADWVEPLRETARAEADHEAYFRSKIEGHPWTAWLPLWDPPPALKKNQPPASGG